MNKVILLGRLTRDPEIRYAQSTAEPLCIARYTLAVNKRFKREGEPDADFISCTAIGKLGEIAEKYFKKGMQVSVCGRLQVRSFDDPQSNQKRWITEVVLEEQNFAESRAAYEARMQGQGASQPPGYPQSYASAPAPQYGSHPPSHYDNAPKQRNDMPSDFFIDQELNDEDLPF